MDRKIRGRKYGRSDNRYTIRLEQAAEFCINTRFTLNDVVKLFTNIKNFFDNDDDCWLRGDDSTIYTTLTLDSGESIIASRMSYEIFNGERLYNRLACHNCDTPSCIKPSHLFKGTNADNMQDAVNKGRRSTKTIHKKVKLPLTFAGSFGHGY